MLVFDPTRSACLYSLTKWRKWIRVPPQGVFGMDPSGGPLPEEKEPGTLESSGSQPWLHTGIAWRDLKEA